MDSQPNVISHRVGRKIEMAGVISQTVHDPENSAIRKHVMETQSSSYFFKGKVMLIFPFPSRTFLRKVIHGFVTVTYFGLNIVFRETFWSVMRINIFCVYNYFKTCAI